MHRLVNFTRLLFFHAENIDQIPLKVLSDRRPDIQNLPLTCENTSTPSRNNNSVGI